MNKKVVVAFSGGLDTSYTVMKLTQDGWDVYAACANTGGFSAEQLKTNEENAYKLGAVKYVTLDVTHEYYEKSLKYMIFGNVLRNNCYPISVSSERIFQAIAIARYAKEIGADAIAHGSTGAGNDQIRFDMTFLVMAPGVEIITLTRDKKLTRKEEVDYLNEHGFFADFTKLKYSYNVGIWGTSICGGELLDPTQGLPEEAYLKHVTAKEQESLLKIEFDKGEIVEAIQKIEEIGASYAIGRDANVGDTIIGIKGRVGFEAAAPKLIIEAHRLLEKSTLSKWQQYWKDQVANWYGMFLHESQYLEPVMPDIEAMLSSSQRNVTGTAILKLRPYGFETVGIDSVNDLTKSKLGEYGETPTPSLLRHPQRRETINYRKEIRIIRIIFARNFIQIMTKQEYKDIYDVVGAAMEVHKTLGRGLFEPVYQEALFMEMKDRGMVAEREKQLNLYYKGTPMEKTYYADFYYKGIRALEQSGISTYQKKTTSFFYHKRTTKITSLHNSNRLFIICGLIILIIPISFLNKKTTA